MNDAILYNLITTVEDDDTLYILGDVIMGSANRHINLLKMIPGHVIIIRGNHDSDTKVKLYEELGWEVCDAAYLTINHIHFFLCHYPTIVADFPKALRNTVFCLHGHTHSKNSTGNYINNIHVGVDSFKCCPVSSDFILNEIYTDIKKPSNERKFAIE